MNKYQTGKIYKLIDNTNGNEYYGSTIQDLKKRKSRHVTAYKRYLNKKTNYVITSYVIIKNNNYEIYLVEDFPCNSKNELETREAYYIRNNNCVNKFIPCRTQKEWAKQYYIDNKEKLKENHTQYRINNKEKIKEYYNNNKEKNNEKAKINHNKNKERDNLKSKEYHHKNKERNNLISKNYYHYINTWGGDPRCNNNLLKINLNIFN